MRRDNGSERREVRFFPLTRKLDCNQLEEGQGTSSDHLLMYFGT